MTLLLRPRPRVPLLVMPSNNGLSPDMKTFASPSTDANMEREQGRKAQLSNISAAKVESAGLVPGHAFSHSRAKHFVAVIHVPQTVADIIRTCLGPRSMLKMLLDPMGGIVLTNDGNAILREVEVTHPAAKSMIELSRTQDEEVGDGTTSVIILGTANV